MTVYSNETDLYTYLWVEPMSYRFFFLVMCVFYRVGWNYGRWVGLWESM